MIFKLRIGRNVKVYIDVMLVKSPKLASHISYLEEAFNVMRKYQMKLNPSKYAFGITSGGFFGFMITSMGIKGNLEEIS